MTSKVLTNLLRQRTLCGISCTQQVHPRLISTFHAKLACFSHRCHVHQSCHQQVLLKNPLFNCNPCFPLVRNASHKKNSEAATNDLTLQMEEFNSAFQGVYNDLICDTETVSLTVQKRLSSVLKYNVLDGKKIRGMMVVTAYKLLSNGGHTAEGLRLAYILGWCLELLQSYFLVCDDIMDNSTQRRGKPCWFRLPGVGLEAINDSLMLETAIFYLLKKHFRKHPCYTQLMELFHEVNKFTIWGQCLDMEACQSNRKSWEPFTYHYYYDVIQYKTCHYTFRLPIHLAMLLIGTFEEKHFEASEEICLKLGNLFQLQDDYLDVYGDPQVTGKVGNDIKEGKCTWFSVTALDQSSSSGKRIMEENYGVGDPAAIAKVLELYDSLRLRQKYFETEERLHTEIVQLISKLEWALNKDLFIALLESLHNRKK